MMKEVDTYFTVEEEGENGKATAHHPYFGLYTSDLTLIRPTVDAPGGSRSPSHTSMYPSPPSYTDELDSKHCGTSSGSCLSNG